MAQRSDSNQKSRYSSSNLFSFFLKMVNIIIVLIVCSLFIVTAPFTINPLALSPIGLTLITFVMLIALRLTVKLLTRWIDRRNWKAGALAALLFIPNPGFPPTSTPPPFWDMMFNNVEMLGNPYAWQASLEINIHQGIPGLAPILYRPIVENHPIKLVAVPGPTPDSFEPYAAVSGMQVVPFGDSHAIWNTISQNSLPVTNIIMMADQTTILTQDPLTTINSFAVNCNTCTNTYRLEVNPEYVEKLSWEVGAFVLGPMPLGRTLKVGDVLAAAFTTDHLLKGDLQGAGATVGGRLAGRTVSFFGESDSWITTVSSWGANKMTQQVINSGNDNGLEWNFKVYQTSSSNGPISVGGSTYAWQATIVDTYSAGGAMSRQGEFHFSHTSTITFDPLTPTSSFSTEPKIFERINPNPSIDPLPHLPQDILETEKILTPPVEDILPIQPDLSDIRPYQPQTDNILPFTPDLNDIQPYVPPVDVSQPHVPDLSDVRLFIAPQLDTLPVNK